MKRKAVMAGALLLIFILGFVAIVPAQTDPEFRTFLSRLNGSRWVYMDEPTMKMYMELEGDILTEWFSMGETKTTEFSVKLDKRRFVVKTPNKALILEISRDGEMISEKVTYSRDEPGSVGAVLEYIKKN